MEFKTNVVFFKVLFKCRKNNCKTVVSLTTQNYLKLSVYGKTEPFLDKYSSNVTNSI